jgi:predicted DNA-binding transcriptional regulator YafY
MDPPEAEGWVKACVEFEVIEEACAYVLGLGPQVEVLEPRELREKVVQLAEEIVVVYTRRAEEKR